MNELSTNRGPIRRGGQITSLREKYPYSELFWSAFFRIRTEYGERVQSEGGKMRIRIAPNTDTFHAVLSTASYTLSFIFHSNFSGSVMNDTAFSALRQILLTNDFF